jgi:uroporphyrinogen-III decarboxylase
MTVTNRERYRAIAHFQRQGDLFTEDEVWPETLALWVQQGAPKEILDAESEVFDVYVNSFFRNYFRFSNKRVMNEVKSGWAGDGPTDIGQGIPAMGGSPLVPAFDVNIISEDERTITFINGAGQTMKAMKNKPVMPMFLGWPVKDKASWEALKKKLDPNTPQRWPADWTSYTRSLNEQNDPVVLQVGGFYGHPRDWIGSENILYMFYDNPGLIEDMMDHMLYLETEIVKKVVKDVKVDEAYYYEDMAYKAGPLISPAMARKFLLPRYKKLNDLLRSNGIDIISVDCDGNNTQLIPFWLEAGINYVWPLEQAAGNDAIAFRKKYGKDLILGGAIDKRALAKGKEAIRHEVMSKVPFLLEQGGYFPSIDHGVPPDVSFENYCFYVNTLREAAGLDKLSL